MRHISHERSQRVRMTFSTFPLQRRTMADRMFPQQPTSTVSAWRPKCLQLHSHTCRRITRRRQPLKSIRRKDRRCSRFKQPRFATQWPTSVCLVTTGNLIWFWTEASKLLGRQRQLDQVARRHPYRRKSIKTKARDWRTSELICLRWRSTRKTKRRKKSKVVVLNLELLKFLLHS